MTAGTARALLRLGEALSAAEVVQAAEAVGVLSFLAESGTVSVAQVAEGCRLDPQATGRLLAVLAAFDVLAPTPPDGFSLVVDVRRWPDLMSRQWGGLPERLRSGRPRVAADTPGGAAALYPAVVPQLGWMVQEAAEAAARVLAPLAGAVLDVGAGAAPWSLALARAAPSARVTCLDLPEVLATTRAQVEAAGLGGRFDYLAGDVFAVELPAGTWDLVLLGNVCHLFDAAGNAALLRRLARVLRPGGTLAVIDLLPAQDDGARTRLALYELGLLTRTASGRVHSPDDYASWGAAAGLRCARVERLDSPFDLGLILLDDGERGRVLAAAAQNRAGSR